MSYNSDNKVIFQLEQMGFKHNEQAILACLLDGSVLSASQLAKSTKIKRPTVYPTLENLINLGLIVRQAKARHTSFAIVNKEIFFKLIENRVKEQAIKTSDACNELKGLLKQQANSIDLSGFVIETLKSLDAIYEQLSSVLVAGNYDAIFNPQLVCNDKYSKKIIQNFLAETSRTKPKIREIVVSGKEAVWYKSNINNKNHLVKTIGTNFKILSDVIITDDSVIISHYNSPDDVAIRIKHAGYVQTNKAIFNMLWNQV